MGRITSQLDDVLSATLEDHKTEFQEQFFLNNIVLKKMQQKAEERLDGGTQIIRSVVYQAHQSAQWTARNGSVTVGYQNIGTQAIWDWARLTDAVTITDDEEAENAGSNKLWDVLSARIETVRESIDQQLELGMLASSTADANTIWSLYDIVDTADPTLANFGGLDRDTHIWWQATKITSGSMATQGLENMRTGAETVSRSGMEKPNLYVTTLLLFNAYKSRLFPLVQLGKTGDAEFDHLMFEGYPIVYSHAAQTGVLLGLNTKYLKFIGNKNMMFKNYPFTRAVGGRSRSSVIATMCQLISLRPRSNFKLISMVA